MAREDSADRRFTYRLDVPEGRVRLVVPGCGPAVVADLSASGSGLIVDPRDLSGVTAERATFEFAPDRSFSVKLDAVRISEVAGQLRVGARFQDLPPSGMRVLSEFLIREFLDGKRTLDRILEDPRTLTTKNPKFIRRYLRRCLLIEGRPLRVYDHGSVLPLTIAVEQLIDLSGCPAFGGRFHQAGLIDGEQYTFVVPLSGSVMHFASRVTIRGSSALIPLPEELHHAGFRDSVRTRMAERGSATVRCVHPRLPEQIAGRPVLDMSARGLSFESDPETDLLFPGDRLSVMEVSFEDETFQLRGVIRSIAPHAVSGTYACGVEVVEFADAKQERRWRERAFRHAHPRAMVTDPVQAAGLSWGVLDSSGYVRLWTPRDKQEHLRAAYTERWSEPPRDIGQLVLVGSGGSAVGTLAGSLLYPKTWLVHQLGVDERVRTGIGNFLSLAFELYSGLLYLFQAQAQVEYFVIFAERDRRWSEVLYADFVAHYPERASLSYRENRVFRRDVNAPVSRRLPRGGGIEVSLADAGELDALSGALSAAASQLECDALAYGASELSLAAFSTECRALGCERARSIYVARENGVPIAALLAESGSEGVNIFGLMNRCSIVSLDQAPVPENVRGFLLERAVEHFRQLGKQVFLFIDAPDTDVAAVALLGFEFISDGMRFIASKRVVPAWLSYLKNVLTLREASREGSAR